MRSPLYKFLVGRRFLSCCPHDNLFFRVVPSLVMRLFRNASFKPSPFPLIFFQFSSPFFKIPSLGILFRPFHDPHPLSRHESLLMLRLVDRALCLQQEFSFPFATFELHLPSPGFRFAPEGSDPPRSRKESDVLLM